MIAGVALIWPGLGERGRGAERSAGGRRLERLFKPPRLAIIHLGGDRRSRSRAAVHQPDRPTPSVSPVTEFVVVVAALAAAGSLRQTRSMGHCSRPSVPFAGTWELDCAQWCSVLSRSSLPICRPRSSSPGRTAMLSAMILSALFVLFGALVLAGAGGIGHS